MVRLLFSSIIQKTVIAERSISSKGARQRPQVKLYFKADDNRKYPSDLDYGNLERSHATGIGIR